MTQSSIWLGTVGLGRQFGGVAHVARCTVNAFSGKESPFRLSRIVSLLDTRDSIEATYLTKELSIKRCHGSRVWFTARIIAQAASPPSLVLFDHVDIAQCQMLLPRWRRPPYAVWVHGIEVWKELPKRKLDALRGADLLIFNSEFTKDRFESFHGHDFPARIVHLTGGQIDQDSQRLQTARKPWILTVGRLEPNRPKGHKQILDALPKIAAAVPEVQWHVVGKGGALESFRRLVANSPASNHIHLHGFLPNDQLQQLFFDSRVFAMPSFGEGFGVVYLEAMERGCVPLGSTLDAAPEVIGDGGVCLDPNDRGCLENTLIEMLTESEADFGKRSERALARASLFAPQKFHSNLIDALQTIGDRVSN